MAEVSLLSKTLKKYSEENEEPRLFQELRQDMPELLAEYMFAIGEPVLVRDILKLVPDDQAIYKKMNFRFKLLILLDYVLDSDRKAEDLKKQFDEFDNLIGQSDLPGRISELASFALCEFKLQVCLAYMYQAGKKGGKSVKSTRKIVNDIYGSSKISAKAILDSKEDNMIFQSLLATNKEDLMSLFVEEDGELTIDADGLEFIEEEHSWEDFKSSFRSFVEQLQIHFHGLPKLMKMFARSKKKVSEEVAISDSSSSGTFVQDVRMEKLKKAFIDVGGTEQDWNATLASTESNLDRFERKVKKKKKRHISLKKREAEFPSIVIPIDEQYDHVRVKDSEIIRFLPGQKAARAPPVEEKPVRRKRSRSRSSSDGEGWKKPGLPDPNDESSTDVEEPPSDNDSTEEEEQAQRPASSTNRKRVQAAASPQHKAAKAVAPLGANDVANKGAPKRVVRKRVRWSEAEVEALRYGVKEFGAGNWAKILRMSEDFHSCRNAVALKDKWRILHGDRSEYAN